MLRLPVSGVEVALRAPDGTDDILLQEASGHPVEVGLALLARLAEVRNGAHGVGHGRPIVAGEGHAHDVMASEGQACGVTTGEADSQAVMGSEGSPATTFLHAGSDIADADLRRHHEHSDSAAVRSDGSRTTHKRHDWSGLTVTDFEFLLLSLRASRFGQRLDLGFACPECGARVEVGFRVADYLAAVRPRAVAGVTPDPVRPGWFQLDGAGFRLPTAGDQAVVITLANPARHLTERCLDVAARHPPLRGRVMRAMATMAPEVSRPIAGSCPYCTAAVEAPLHVTRVVVAELRRAAGAVHDDVDLIARAYHWPEGAILALPQERRRAYAERIRRAPAQAA